MRHAVKNDPQYQALVIRLGQHIREARLRNELTQQEVADRMGGSPYPTTNRWLSDIERGRNSIDVIQMQRLADVLGHPLAFFTDPKFDARRPQWPQTLNEWLLLAGGDERLATMHHELPIEAKRGKETRRNNISSLTTEKPVVSTKPLEPWGLARIAKERGTTPAALLKEVLATSTTYREAADKLGVTQQALRNYRQRYGLAMVRAPKETQVRRRLPPQDDRRRGRPGSWQDHERPIF